jgi:hypothetical protein
VAAQLNSTPDRASTQTARRQDGELSPREGWDMEDP